MDKLVLFDFDGTLTKINTLKDFAIFCFGKPKTYMAIFRILPLFLLYKLGLLGHGFMKKKYVEVFFKGQNFHDIVQKGNQYCIDRLPEILNKEVYEKFLWHKSKRHKIVIASASLSILLLEWCKKHQVELIGTDVSVNQHDIITGMQGLNCYGDDKVTKIKEQIQLDKFKTIYAYADSKSDIPMLEIANEPYWIQPVDKDKIEMELYMNKETSNNTKTEKFLKRIVNHPVKTLLTFLCLFVVMVPFLSVVPQDFTYRSWFSEEDPMVMKYDSFEKNFGNDDTFAIVVHSPSGIFDQESIKLIHDITEKAWTVPEVFRVDSITNYNWAHAIDDDVVIEPLVDPDMELSHDFLQERKQIALSDEILPGYLISKDGKSTVIYLTLRPLVVDYKAYIEGVFDSTWFQERTSLYETGINKSTAKTQSQKNELLQHISESRKTYYAGLLNDIILKEQSKGGPVNINDVMNIVTDRSSIDFSGLLPASGIDKELSKLGKTEHKELINHLKSTMGNSATQYEIATNSTKKRIEEFRNQTGDHEIHYTGSVPLNDYFREASYNDFGLILPLINLIIIIILYLSIRSVTGVMASLTVMLFSILLGVSSIGVFTFFFEKMSLNAATMAVPVFIMAIGIADAVHILVSVNYFLKKGLAKNKAIYASLEKNFGPTILTTVSTAFAFFSFSSSGVIPIGSLGVICGVGTIFAWIVSYFVLGPLLILLPYAPKLKKFEIAANSNEGEDEISNRANAWGDFIIKNKRVITYGFGTLAIVAAILSFQNVINSDPYKYFKDSTEIRTGLNFIENEIGSPMTVEISINAKKEGGIKDPVFLNKVVEFETWIKSQKNAKGEFYVTKTFSILDVIREMNFSLNEEKADQYSIPNNKNLIAQELLLYNMGVPDNLNLSNLMSVNEDFMRLIVLWKVHDSEEALAESDRFIDKARSLGLDVNITGKMDLWHSLNPKVVKSFYQSIILAVLFISVLLFIIFRSFEFGLYAMIANFIPLFFGGAILKLIGRPLDMGTVVVFSVGLGIAVDDTIHFLFNYKKTRESGMESGKAIKTIFTSIGTALIATSVILVASFSMYLLGEFVPNANFGIMLAVILSFALITDLMFLPAFLMVFKSKTSTVETAKIIRIPAAEEYDSVKGKFK